MDKDARDVKRLVPWCDNVGLSHLLLALCLCALLTGQLTNPMLAQSDQHSITAPQSPADQGKVGESKLPAKPQKELLPAESPAQESKPVQPNTHTPKSDESKTKKESGEKRGRRREKKGQARKACPR